MKFREFYEKSYGISMYRFLYQGIEWLAHFSTSIPDQLWEKTVEELEFKENNHSIICVVELVD